MIRAVLAILSIAVSGSFIMAQEVGSTKAKSSSSVLVQYATVHVGNGEVIDNAYVAFQGNEITLVTDATKSRIRQAEYDTVIHADGMHMFPGFIVMDSRLGLTEIGAVRATHDFRETGKNNANVRALPAFNTESDVIATARPNGVVGAQIAPKGGLISGQSSYVHFHGANWLDASVNPDEGVFINWPSSYGYGGWWGERSASKDNKAYSKQREELDTFFADAIAYAKRDSGDNGPKNLKLEACKHVIEGQARLYIRANWAKDILDAIQFARKYNLKKVSIVGGAEAHLVSTELKENNISVVIDRVHKTPVHNDDPIDQPFLLAGQLIEAGVEIAFATSGDMEAMVSRNLPFQVGTAVFHGLDYEKAISAITLVPSTLMGMEKTHGSIEPGKVPTFFLCKGDPLDMMTNKIDIMFIEGKQVDLTNRQYELYQKFKKN